VSGPEELDTPVDPLDRALFCAGRRETMPQATRDALLAAAAAGALAAAGAAKKTASAAGTGATPATLAKAAAWKWALLGALAIGGAGTAAWYAAARSVPPAEVRVDEPPAVVTPSAPAEAPAAEPVREAPVEETPAPAEARPQASGPRLSKAPQAVPARSASPPARGADLAAEAALLDEARAAVAAGEAARALTLLDRHRRDYSAPELGDEAFVLRVEALSKQGDHAAARRLAEPWLAANPKSPYAARVRRSLARAPETASP
jgi:hypothetical protein